VFKSLYISNFRGIKDLEIKDFGKINLIVGENNSGKTTILDALFLITNPVNPRLISNINIFRGFNRLDESFFTSYFYKFNTEIPANIHVSLEDGSERDLVIEPRFEDDSEGSLSSIDHDGFPFIDELSIDNSVSEINGVSLFYRNNELDSEPLVSHTFLSPQEGLKFQAPKHREVLKGVYIHSKNSTNTPEERFEKVVVDKKLDYIIDVLKIIEPDLTDIRLGVNGLIFCDVGYKKLIPINAMGDGIQKLLSLILAMYYSRNGAIFIDEFENGIYFSKFPQIWNTLLKASHNFNCQIFATTHSIEAINSFAKLSKDSDLFSKYEDVKLFRVEQYKDEHEIISFNKNILLNSLEKGFEIR
tara:strand:- start:53 stop:1129 length:1077 start_codon:yes stop_codon:yes gene_type:complete